MVEGEPSRDVFAMDVARFGSFSTRSYTRNKVIENYQKRFSVSYPNEELPAGRPLHTTPLYEIWKARGAVFGQGYGMEHVNYFAKAGEPRFETPSFNRSNAFEAVGEECRGVREGVGLNEIHNFGKFELTGEGATEWLDTIMAGRIPAIGRLTLSAMLSPKGRIIGDFTISRFAENHYQLTSSYGAQAFHLRWFEKHLPETGVKIENISDRRIGLQIAGPKARELLAKVTNLDVSDEAFRFLDVKIGEVGLCDAIIQRVSYAGDLGYEIYVNNSQVVSLYHTLNEAGKAFGLKPFGMRAMMSLRLEKGFGSWLREFSPDYTPLETGLDRFVSYDKSAEFIGKESVCADRGKGAGRLLTTFIVDVEDTDVNADEPI